jgi:hypothetical protein
MKVFFAILITLTLSACGSYQQTIQVDDQSYIQLSGDPEGVEIILNGKSLGKVENFNSYDLDGTKTTRFEITPGTHIIELTRTGETLIKRKIYVTEGNAFEVKLP